MLPARFQAWTLPQVSVSSTVQGSGFAPVIDEGQPEVAAIRVEPGVDPGDVGIEDRARLGGERGEIPFRRLPPAEGPDEPVLLERARPEQLGEASGRDAPPDLHLPHPLLGVDDTPGQRTGRARWSR